MMCCYKKLFVLPLLLFFSMRILAQNNANLLRDAHNLELKFDEAGALEKYKQITASDVYNIDALVKCAELNCSIGAREKDNKSKLVYFTAAQNFAQQAYTKDSTNADACYAMALVATKFSTVETDNKKLVPYIKQIKVYTDKTLAINSNHAKANYILGNWHFELILSSWLKKPGMKNFYDGIFDTQVDSAAYFMEKCRSIEPYYALNYLDLAKVYAYDHQPGKAIEVLNKLVKLPNRMYDDEAIKQEGKQMLATMQ